MHPKYWKPHRNHFLRSPATGEGEAGGGALDTSQAADAFSSLFGGESQEETVATAQAAVTETPEEAAERLLTEDANQNSASDDEQKEKPAYDPNETVTVEIDGKMVELTKAQVAEAKKGELRQQDYTRKTMEAAEERKAASAEKQAARTERDNYAQQLQNYILTSESILAEQEQALTEELMRSDPVEYMALERTFRQRQAQAAKAQHELHGINQQRQQEHAESVQTFLKTQQEILADKLPEWKDPMKQKAHMAALEPYLQERGYTKDDGMAILDARFLMMASEAMKYRDLMTRAKETAGKVQKAPAKVERPGNGVAPTDGRTKAMKSLESSGGSLSAAAGVFAQFL